MHRAAPRNQASPAAIRPPPQRPDLAGPRRAAIFAVIAAGSTLAAAPPGCSSEPNRGAASSTSGGGGAPSSSASSASSGGGGGGGATSSGGQGGAALPDTFTVSGVVTDGSAPLEGAIVMQGGGEPAMITGPDGAFSITLTKAIPGIPTVVAAKIGYRSRGYEVDEYPVPPVTLDLIYAVTPDNELYTFGEPGVGDALIDNSTKYCGHCHTTLTAQFQTSAHARATKDPLVQDLYAGVTEAAMSAGACSALGGTWRAGLLPGSASTPADKCYIGGGVLPDLNPGCGGPGAPSCDDPALPAAQRPTAFGRCADCHAIGTSGKAGGRSLLDATGAAYESGNHCDPCHHIRDIDLSKPPGTGGRVILQRPRETLPNKPNQALQIMYGPYPDVPLGFMGGSYQPKFSTAELCAGCHDQRQEAMLPGASLDPQKWPDGLPTHSTFTEWSEGPFNTPGTPCQFCHMPPVSSLLNGLDLADPAKAGIVFGFIRPKEKIRSHVFRGPLAGAPRLIDGAVAAFLSVSQGAGDVSATLTLKNTGCGHAIPTGEPMRSLLVVVRAEACGAPLEPSGGMTLNDVGGARAEGVVGQDVAPAGALLTWAAGAARAKPGDVVRAVRPTGVFDDYNGIGLFAGQALTPAQKGLEIRAPAGSASVLSAGGGSVTLSAPLALQPGDIVYLGEALPWPPVDGQTSIAAAGAAGYSFARTMVGPAGARGVAHYRAVDIASDNRIAPQAEATTQHSFTVPPGCAGAPVSVTAAVLYRPIPVNMAELRGWPAKDYVIATTKESAMLP